MVRGGRESLGDCSDDGGDAICVICRGRKVEDEVDVISEAIVRVKGRK